MPNLDFVIKIKWLNLFGLKQVIVTSFVNVTIITLKLFIPGVVEEFFIAFKFHVSDPGDEFAHDLIVKGIFDVEIHEWIRLSDELQLNVVKRVLFIERNCDGHIIGVIVKTFICRSYLKSRLILTNFYQ